MKLFEKYLTEGALPENDRERYWFASQGLSDAVKGLSDARYAITFFLDKKFQQRVEKAMQDVDKLEREFDKKFAKFKK